MTMLPNSAISSAFAATRPRRFANLPPGCTVAFSKACESDGSELDGNCGGASEEGARLLVEARHRRSVRVRRASVMDRSEESEKEKESAMTKERERELDAYFEQLDKERESLSQIYQRVGDLAPVSLLDPKGESREGTEG